MVPRLPQAVRTDNDPEFTSRAFIAWTHLHGIRHLLIQSGRPMQNGYIESCNGKFRNVCLTNTGLPRANCSPLGLWAMKCAKLITVRIADICEVQGTHGGIPYARGVLN